jgi:hypothetical protein
MTLRTSKPSTEAYVERNRQKHNFFQPPSPPHTPVKYAELTPQTMLNYEELDPFTPVINRN